MASASACRAPGNQQAGFAVDDDLALAANVGADHGEPIAPASAATRPNASGSRDGAITISARAKAAGMSSQCPTKEILSSSPCPRICSFSPCSIGFPALRVAGENHAPALQAALIQQAAASMASRWPFQPVRRPGRRIGALGLVEPPGGGQGMSPLRGNGVGRKFRDVDAARNGHEAVGRFRVFGADMGGGEFGIGDDGVAARHDRIVEPLGRDVRCRRHDRW